MFKSQYLLKNRLRSIIELKVDGSIRTAKVTKQRDMESGKKVAFTLDIVELGLDNELEAITSCIVKQTDVPESGPKEIGVFANVLLEGSYQKIDLELGKTHDEYEKQINEYIKF